MPLNEIEQHPFLNYTGAWSDTTTAKDYTKLIIGSFPVYELTDTIFPSDRVENRWSEPSMKMPFFYGSDTNSFWNRLALTFGLLDPQQQETSDARKGAAIELLEKNHILLTDIVYRTNRQLVSRGITDGFAPADQALFNISCNPDIRSQFQLNRQIIPWLTESENIRSVYFTAQKKSSGKNPGGWFHQLLREKGIQYKLLSESPNALQYEMALGRTRQLTLFFLPTPSGKRSVALTQKRRHPMFVNYLRSSWPGYLEHVRNNYPLKEPAVAEHREKFIQEWWTAFLEMENMAFDGSPIHTAI